MIWLGIIVAMVLVVLPMGHRSAEEAVKAVRKHKRFSMFWYWIPSVVVCGLLAVIAAVYAFQDNALALYLLGTLVFMSACFAGSIPTARHLIQYFYPNTVFSTRRGVEIQTLGKARAFRWRWVAKLL